MKILKTILIALGILIAIPLVVALFMEKKYAVEREIVINRPKAEVFEYLKSLKRQSNWSTWVLQDPKIQMTYGGEEGTVGSYAEWKSDEMGSGRQTVKNIIEGERIETELHFTQPYESYSPARLVTEAVGEAQTKVKWAMDGEMAYPFNFMQVFMSMDEMIGTEYAKSLANLKAILEK